MTSLVVFVVVVLFFRIYFSLSFVLFVCSFRHGLDGADDRTVRSNYLLVCSFAIRSYSRIRLDKPYRSDLCCALLECSSYS